MTLLIFYQVIVFIILKLDDFNRDINKNDPIENVNFEHSKRKRHKNKSKMQRKNIPNIFENPLNLIKHNTEERNLPHLIVKKIIF